MISRKNVKNWKFRQIRVLVYTCATMCGSSLLNNCFWTKKYFPLTLFDNWNTYCTQCALQYAHCGNLIFFLSCRFYVKLLFWILEDDKYQKLPFWHYFWVWICHWTKFLSFWFYVKSLFLSHRGPEIDILQNRCNFLVLNFTQNHDS